MACGSCLKNLKSNSPKPVYRPVTNTNCISVEELQDLLTKTKGRNKSIIQSQLNIYTHNCKAFELEINAIKKLL